MVKFFLKRCSDSYIEKLLVPSLRNGDTLLQENNAEAI